MLEDDLAFTQSCLDAHKPTRRAKIARKASLFMLFNIDIHRYVFYKHLTFVSV